MKDVEKGENDHSRRKMWLRAAYVGSFIIAAAAVSAWGNFDLNPFDQSNPNMESEIGTNSDQTQDVEDRTMTDYISDAAKGGMAGFVFGGVTFTLLFIREDDYQPPVKNQNVDH